MQNSFRDKQRSAELHHEKVSRVADSVTKATTIEESEDVLFSNDVVDILCGPAETKIRQLERQLREEKLSHQRTKRFDFD